MKNKLLPLLLATAMPACYAAEKDEWQFKAGLAVASYQEIWRDTDNGLSLVPILSAEYGRWSIGQDALVAYQVLDDEGLNFTVGLDYRSDGYDADGLISRNTSDNQVFNGYKSPDGDLVLDVSGQWQYVRFGLQQDISDHSGALTADLGVEVPLYQSEQLKLVSSAGLQWLSEDYVNYNYGIAGSQVDNSVGRVAYAGDAAVNYHLGLAAVMPINKHWQAMAVASYDWLDDSISDSPLVGRDKVASAMIGVVYNF